MSHGNEINTTVFHLDENLGLIVPKGDLKLERGNLGIAKIPDKAHKPEDIKGNYTATGKLIIPSAPGLSVQKDELVTLGDTSDLERQDLDKRLTAEETSIETPDKHKSTTEVLSAITAPREYFNKKLTQRLGDTLAKQNIQWITSRDSRPLGDQGMRLEYVYEAVKRRDPPEDDKKLNLKFYTDINTGEKVSTEKKLISPYETALNVISEIVADPNFANTKVGLRGVRILDSITWSAHIGSEFARHHNAVAFSMNETEASVEFDELNSQYGNRTKERLEFPQVVENLLTLLESTAELDTARTYTNLSQTSKSRMEKGGSVKDYAYRTLENIDVPDTMQEKVLAAMDKRGDLNHPLACKLYMQVTKTSPECAFVLEQQARHEKMLKLLESKNTQTLFEQFVDLQELTAGLVMPLDINSVTHGSFNVNENPIGRIGIELEVTPSHKAYNLTRLPTKFFWLGMDLQGNGEIRNFKQATLYDRQYIEALVELAQYTGDNFPHISSLHLHLDQENHTYDKRTSMLRLWGGKDNISESRNRLSTYECRNFVPPLDGANRINTASMAGLMEMAMLSTNPYKNKEEKAQIALNPGTVEKPDHTVDIQKLIWGHIVNNTTNPQVRLSALFALKDQFTLKQVDIEVLLKNYDSKDQETSLDNKILVFNSFAKEGLHNVVERGMGRKAIELMYAKYGLCYGVWESYKVFTQEEVKTENEKDSTWYPISERYHLVEPGEQNILDLVFDGLDKDTDETLNNLGVLIQRGRNKHELGHVVHMFREYLYASRYANKITSFDEDKMRKISNFMQKSYIFFNRKEDDVLHIFSDWEAYKIADLMMKESDANVTADEKLLIMPLIKKLPPHVAKDRSLLENLFRKFPASDEQLYLFDNEIISHMLKTQDLQVESLFKQYLEDYEVTQNVINLENLENNPELVPFFIAKDYLLDGSAQEALQITTQKLLVNEPEKFELNLKKYIEGNEGEINRWIEKLLRNPEFLEILTDTNGQATKEALIHTLQTISDTPATTPLTQRNIDISNTLISVFAELPHYKETLVKIDLTGNYPNLEPLIDLSLDTKKLLARAKSVNVLNINRTVDQVFYAYLLLKRDQKTGELVKNTEATEAFIEDEELWRNLRSGFLNWEYWGTDFEYNDPTHELTANAKKIFEDPDLYKRLEVQQALIEDQSAGLEEEPDTSEEEPEQEREYDGRW